MATVLGEAGGSALRGALIRVMVLPAAILIFLMIVTPFAVSGYARAANRLLYVVVALVVSALSFYFTRREWIDGYEMLVESRDWARGAAGERAASRDLAQLPDDYLILNDVHPGFRGPSARWNWDHVLIGPKGIFVVDAKNYSASRIQNGRSDTRTRRNVKQVRNYARSFKAELLRLNPELARVFVVPVLAYVNELTWVEQLRDGDVRVLPKRLLRNDILTGQGSDLPVGEAVKIANLLFAMYTTDQQALYRESFRAWAARIRMTPWVPELPSTDSTHATTATGPCPVCGAVMRLRSGSYGSFYGCSKFRETKCRGKRGLDGTAK